ncbi:MAG TPA: hypothetical protein VFU31_07940, partial [Candidatus Binatia bacterium]|nr:hypothetical protein [Candidatus Binatia bacterium]
PGETDEQFENSLEYFASLPLTYFHVFPYSSRRGTMAASLAGHVPADKKKERARRMRELGEHKKREFWRRFLGDEVSVLIEEKIDRKNGRHRGFSRNYLPVVVCGTGDCVNREIRVRIKRFDGGCLLGDALLGDVTVGGDLAANGQ